MMLSSILDNNEEETRVHNMERVFETCDCSKFLRVIFVHLFYENS